MNKKLKKNLGIILLASLLSIVLNFATIGIAKTTANAEDTPPAQPPPAQIKCQLNDFTNHETVKTHLKKADITEDEIRDCITKSKEALEACTANPAQNCDAQKESYKTASAALGAKLSTVPIEDYIKTKISPPVTDMFDEASLCLTDAPAGYQVIIEEAIESDITQNDNILNCIRNTFCVKRTDKLGIECVTTLRKAGDGAGCSGQARTYAKTESNNASIYCQPVQVLISPSGTGLIFLYVGTIYRWAASVIGIIAVLVIVISGIQISAAAGEQQAVTNAKNRIFQSLGGLVLLFLSGIILYSINPTFFTSG